MVKRFVGLFAVILLVASAFVFKNSVYYKNLKYRLGSFFSKFTSQADIVKHNIGQDINPQRKPPLSFTVKETKLAYFAPQVFGEFDRAEWAEFWMLIYGHKKVGEGPVKQKVYRDKEEIREILMYKYPDPFARNYFTEQHWGYLWSIIFSK